MDVLARRWPAGAVAAGVVLAAALALLPGAPGVAAPGAGETGAGAGGAAPGRGPDAAVRAALAAVRAAVAAQDRAARAARGGRAAGREALRAGPAAVRGPAAAGRAPSVGLLLPPGVRAAGRSGTSAVAAAPSGALFVAVTRLGPGRVRYAAVINGASSPHVLRYRLVLPPGAGARLRPDGGVDVELRRGGAREVLARVAAPWARDAAGRAVPTRYALEGPVLVQHVAARAPSGPPAYPVVADPLVTLGTGLYVNLWLPQLVALGRVPVAVVTVGGSVVCALVNRRVGPWAGRACAALGGLLPWGRLMRAARDAVARMQGRPRSACYQVKAVGPGSWDEGFVPVSPGTCA